MEKWIEIAASQFGRMLRNPVYMRKIYVPETENEKAHLVEGVHQAILPSDLFLKVQKILNKRMENHSHLCSKEKLRDELPLGGLLKCSQCGRNWTGSISSGNGGKYPYIIAKKVVSLALMPQLLMNNLSNFLIHYSLPPEVIDL